MMAVLAQRSLKYGMKAVLKGQQKLNLATSKDFYYFGYGANLSIERLQKFSIKAEVIGTALLPDHQLRFDLACEYAGKGFAGISPSEQGQVWGTLFKTNREGLVMLDILEWVPFNFYQRKMVKVKIKSEEVSAYAYFTVSPRADLTPSKAYLDYVVQSAKTAGLPSDYIKWLAQHETRQEFSFDHAFRLSNPAKPRLYPQTLKEVYRWHDLKRERLTKLIP